MAELLVRLVDKVNADPALDAGCTKRGDVIVVKEDGWPWGDRENDGVTYKVYRLPISVAEAEQFLGSQRPETAEPTPFVHRRAFGIDLEKLEAGVMDIAALKKAKQPLVDPRRFGDDKRVFG